MRATPPEHTLHTLNMYTPLARCPPPPHTHPSQHTSHPSRPLRYAEEGIPALSLDTTGLDNAPCRHLLEGVKGGPHQGFASPKGLLFLIEEECQVLYLLWRDLV